MSKYIKVKGADYTTVDADRDLIHKGAVKVNGRAIKFLYNHDSSKVLGNVVELSDEADGLYAIIKLADPDKSPLVKQALYEMEEGLIDKMSIGFSYKDYSYNEAEGYFDIKELQLYEISMTAIPSNNETAFLGEVEYEENATLSQEVSDFVMTVSTML